MLFTYAVGFSAAVKLSDNVISGDSSLREKYLDFLKSGGSDYPIELLKNAGVDLSTSEAIDSAMSLFSEMLAEFKDYIG